MAKNCKNCGAELADDALICSQCGTILSGTEYEIPVHKNVEPVEAEAPAEQPAGTKAKKKKWWLIPIAAVLALIIAAAFLWKPILLRVSPERYLAMAAGKTMASLDKRPMNTPMGLLAKAGEYMTDGTMRIGVDFSNEYMEGISANVIFAATQEAKKWTVHTDIAYEEEDVDVDLYMDGNFLALSTSLIDEGRYYGLAYDTFTQDLRKSALGDGLTEDMIRQFGDIVGYVDENLNNPVDYDQIAAPYIRILTEYSESLEAVAGSDTLKCSDTELKCDTVSYTADHKSMMALLTKLADQLESDKAIQDLYRTPMELSGEDFDAQWAAMMDQIRTAMDELSKEQETNLHITYYIHDTKLIAAGMQAEAADNDEDETVKFDILLNLGSNPEKGDIRLDVTVDDGEDPVTFTYVSSSSYADGLYKSVQSITGKSDNSSFDINLRSDWDTSTGKMQLAVECQSDEDSVDAEFAFVLKEKENGFEVRIDDLREFIDDALGDDAEYLEDFDCSIILEITKGSNIKTPEYTNLDKIDADTVSGWMTDIFPEPDYGDEW